VSQLRATAAAAVILTLAATGCSGGDSGDTAKPQALTKVTYVTGLGLRAYESYMHIAIEKGYFKQAGLAVEITPGQGTNGNLKLLTAGQADFAVLDLTGALIAYAGPSKTRGFTVVAAIHQRTLACLTALQGSGITSPGDLRGKSIGYQPGGVVQTLFPTYAKLAGLDAKTTKWVSVPSATLPSALASGKVDAITQLVVGTPSVENAAKPRKAVVLPYADYLGDLYGNVLGVSTQTAQQKPDLVRGFRDAMLRGLAYLSDHPDEAGQTFVKRVPGYQTDVATTETALLVPYLTSSGALGVIDQARLQKSIALLEDAGAVAPGSVKPVDIVDFNLTPTS
jgi:NitT/TauT family transport system substrate-binding protein